MEFAAIENVRTALDVARDRFGPRHRVTLNLHKLVNSGGRDGGAELMAAFNRLPDARRREFLVAVAEAVACDG